MENYYENKIIKNQISFCLTDKATIDEREIHSYHEILLFLEGDAELFTINGRRVLKEPSIIIIPAETYHLLRTRKSPSFTRLKISFPSNVMENTPLEEMTSGIKVVDNLSEGLKTICDKLCGILRMNDKNADFYAYSAFLMLISELNMHDVDDDGEKQIVKNEFMNIIAEYISDNLSERLSIKKLSELVHISPSGITHTFKKEFGIPIHRYIIQKRLIFAKHLAQNGEPLCKIYSDVGFRDYSSFYKAYINYFGNAPSKDKT